jgi:hypothetical protein
MGKLLALLFNFRLALKSWSVCSKHVYALRHPMEGAPLGLDLALQMNKTSLKNVAKDKHSSLFHLTISKKNKKFSKIDTWNRIDRLDRCFRDLGPML